LIAQADKGGRRQLMMSEIIDHRILDDAIPRSQGTFVYSNGVKQRKLTTRGWDLLEEWKDGSTDWLAQKDYEKTYPIEFEEYTVKHDLQEEPVFAWCIQYVLKKRDRILKKG
jgi:hypothetical protein